MTATNYTRELADAICSRMAEGESLRAICRDPGMPSEGTVRGWAVRDHDRFGERYCAARSLLEEYWADQIIDIADEPDLDPRDRQVRVHTRQWLMSKLFSSSLGYQGGTKQRSRKSFAGAAQRSLGVDSDRRPNRCPDDLL